MLVPRSGGPRPLSREARLSHPSGRRGADRRGVARCGGSPQSEGRAAPALPFRAAQHPPGLEPHPDRTGHPRREAERGRLCHADQAQPHDDYRLRAAHLQAAPAPRRVAPHGRPGRDQADHPYGNGPALNQWTLPYDATLVATAGHLHPGGLYDDLMAVRQGAAVTARKGGPVPGDVPNSVRLFRSYAHYFGNRAPTSWDVAMTATSKNWRVHLRKGDTLRTTTTYDSKLGSWYESMGIMMGYVAQNSKTGVDPFSHAIPLKGHLTHGHLKENNVHGGTAPGLANPLALPAVPVPGNTVMI